MPDWSYHPVLKPLTAWLPASRRRTLALHGLRAVVSLPGGWLIPEILGHMTPPRSLTATYRGLSLRSPVGLGSGVDPDAVAIGALGRFGFGFVEVGPYLLTDGSPPDLLPPPLVAGRELERLPERLRHRPAGLSVWLRVVVPPDARQTTSRLAALIDHLRGQIEVVCVTAGSADPAIWSGVIATCAERGIRRVLVDLPAGTSPSRLEAALTGGVAGVVVRQPLQPGATPAGLDTIRAVRARSVQSLVVADHGPHSPREVLEAVDAGADLVELDTGIVDAGPGLAKRANEALAGRAQPSRSGLPAWRCGWFWSLLLGAGMLVSGAVVLAVGITRVVLPYDESFLGIASDRFSSINPRLLGFMRHDRITLAATLMSIGILYAGLAWGGMRRGHDWSRRALLASGVVGFASLFLFVGYHYVDPLHVALSTGLFPLFLLGMLLPLRQWSQPSRDLDNDRAWRLGLLGQLLLVGLGAGLVVSGLTITAVGVTRVFVFADLQFLQTTASVLNTANPHLLPLIAHDRAGFGGALASDGVALLFLALWGFRRGEAWVWWTLLGSGLIGFVGGVAAHLMVGYLEVGHLLPVFVSGAVFGVGLLLAFPYVVRPPAPTPHRM